MFLLNQAAKRKSAESLYLLAAVEGPNLDGVAHGSDFDAEHDVCGRRVNLDNDLSCDATGHSG